MNYLLSFSLLVTIEAFGQQEPLSSFYWNNYSYFNPAMCGVESEHEANVTWRSQIDNFKATPNTLFANYGMNLAEKHGIGVNYLFDKSEYTRRNKVKFNYNYQLMVDDSRRIVFGTSLSYQLYEWSWIECPVGYTPSKDLPYLSTNSYTIDLGMAFYGKSIVAGLGVSQLPIYDDNSYFFYNSMNLYFNTQPHVYGNFRFKGDLPFATMILETQMHTDFVQYSQDFNVGVNWRDILEGRVGYRTSDAINFNLTGIIAKKYRIGYAYDITINKLSNISRGTHEISLGLRLE